MADVIEIKGVGPVLAKACAEKGFHSVKEIAEAVPSDLANVRGISQAGAQRLIGAAQEMHCHAAAGGTASERVKSDSVKDKKKNSAKGSKGKVTKGKKAKKKLKKAGKKGKPKKKSKGKKNKSKKSKKKK